MNQVDRDRPTSNIGKVIDNMEKAANKAVTKPVTVAQTDLANKIMEDIKESNLHPSILMPVIEEIYLITKNLLAETRQMELEQYEKDLSLENPLLP